ncbi:MAG: hypothetical protein RLZZ78_419 [Armatimonadota bacterium]
MRHPLSPLTYLTRNPSKVLPMGFVIVLCVFLIAAVASIANSIDLTVRTIYRYTEFFTYVIPQRSTQSVPMDQRAVVEMQPEIDRIIEGGVFFVNIKTVVGRLPFVVIGSSPEERDYLLKRIGATLAEGRMPADGKPEVVVSMPILENRGLKLGDVIAGPLDEGGIAGSPVPVKVVGVLKSDIWVAMSSRTFTDKTFLLTPKCLLLTTKVPSDLDVLNERLMPVGRKGDGLLSPEKVNVLTRSSLLAEVRDSLSSMYMIMEVVSATVIFVIALMSGMLSNIYFTQRIPEFGVLAALGVSRTRLMMKIVWETVILTVIAWAMGSVLSVILLKYLATNVFKQRGLFLDAMDPWAYQHTLPIPIAITVFAMVTVWVRLKRLDAVSVIERR